MTTRGADPQPSSGDADPHTRTPSATEAHALAPGDRPRNTVDTLAAVGEVAALKRIFPRLPVADAALVGPGDDCAVVAAPDGRFVVTTDTMIQGPDFRLAWSTPHDLGWKAAVTNLSDVAAMGATPTALVVAIAAPPETEVGVLEGIADGLRDACSALAPGTGVVGGDLSVSRTLMIAVTAFGDLGGRPPVLRSGARSGDRVAVAGDLGRAGAGIRLLFEKGQVEQPGAGWIPDQDRGEELRRTHAAVVEAQLAPTSPLVAGPAAAAGGATSMLDVSDGLVLDVGRLAEASGCAVDLFHDAIEAEAEALRAVDGSIGAEARDFVLRGGEDHALVATFPKQAVIPEYFRVIGEVREWEVGHPRVSIGGEPYVRPGGWDPFDDWNGATG